MVYALQCMNNAHEFGLLVAEFLLIRRSIFAIEVKTNKVYDKLNFVIIFNRLIRRNFFQKLFFLFVEESNLHGYGWHDWTA